MIARGLQVLPERQNVSSLRGEILHGSQGFVLFFSEAEHQTRLGWNLRMRLLRTAQQLKAALIHRAFANLPVTPRNGFGVVVSNVLPHRKNGAKVFPITATLTHQYSHPSPPNPS